MAVLKCKMCGGDLPFSENAKILECEYCGTVQTIPQNDNEKKVNLFNRANRLRIGNEFDKAAGIYEAIVSEFTEEAEAYWGLCLCKYGIEYVDDPKTALKIPTCHRTLSSSILEDEDYKSAVLYADSVAKDLYEREAHVIDELQKKILEIAYKEEPYDVFISYKEKAYDDGRTRDSVLGQMIYEELVNKGFRVFYAKITLEDYLGKEFEPYIYAALNSAKVMIVLGTKEEHFNAPWVKNEWSRFLEIVRKDPSKTIISCYEGMDPDDIPQEIRRLQAQDLAKVGGIQDLVRGIGKLIAPPVQTANPSSGGYYSSDIEDMLRKVRIHLEDKKWKSAMDSCNRILDIDPECAMAYVYHLARVMRVQHVDDLDKCVNIISENSNYKKAMKYADDELKGKLEQWDRLSRENYQRAVDACTPGVNLSKKVKDIIAGGQHHTVALRTDGTVMACGDNAHGQCNVGNWRSIIAVACGARHTVGLCDDGTVVACGDNEQGQCNVRDWKGIVSISCNEFHTVGVKLDGTVVACGLEENGRCNVNDWKDIVKSSCGYRHTVGQKKDGRLIAVGSNNYGQCDVENWKNIMKFASNNVFTLGLKPNGTVVSCGDNEEGQRNIGLWRNVVDISCGTHHSVGLKSDGSVVSCGMDDYNRCSGTKSWNNIIAVVCGSWHTLGVRADGTVVACGNGNEGQCNVSGWKLFDNIAEIEKERANALAERVAEERLSGYDIFICYDEKKDAEQNRDGELACAIGEKLVAKGYRVFYTTSVLRHYLGGVLYNYLPYAAYSAKCMLVVGSGWEGFFNTKYLWNSYLEVMQSESGRMFAPCYENVSVSELPDELTRYQGLEIKSDKDIDSLVAVLEERIPKCKRKVYELTKEEIRQIPVIRKVSSIGSNDPDDCWPKGTYSDTININQFSVVYFHADLDKEKLRNKDKISNNMKIYNNAGELVFEHSSELDWASNYDRFSKGWILRGDDGSTVPNGRYRLVLTVEDYKPFEYTFVVSATVNNYYQNRKPGGGSFLKNLFNI